MKFFDKNIVVTRNIYDTHLLDKSNWFGDVPPFTNLEINICGICNREHIEQLEKVALFCDTLIHSRRPYG